MLINISENLHGSMLNCAANELYHSQDQGSSLVKPDPSAVCLQLHYHKPKCRVGCNAEPQPLSCCMTTLIGLGNCIADPHA